jgi:mRNA interferase RelE/StbE
MAYRVLLTPRALKELERLQVAERDRILASVRGLAGNPRPYGCVKLAGSSDDLYRIRVGNFRALYSISDQTLTVLVVRVGHRREVYG